MWPIEITLSGNTTLSLSGPRRDDIKGEFCILQTSSITGTPLSNCFVSYPGHTLGKSHPFSRTIYLDFFLVPYQNCTVSKKVGKYIEIIYIYIYIYSHPQTGYFVVSQPFSVARLARFLKLGSKPGWPKRQSKILPLSHAETSASEGNLNA